MIVYIGLEEWKCCKSSSWKEKNHLWPLYLNKIMGGGEGTNDEGEV